MSTYQDHYGDFGPLRMSPAEIDALYRTLPPVDEAIAAQDAAEAKRQRDLAAHIHEQAERAAAMLRHPSVVSKGLPTPATEYVERRDDDTMPSADDIAEMLAWGEQA